MTLVETVILLFGIGLVLLVAELFLPTHGILGIAGMLGIVGAVVACFMINPWLGAVVTAATLIATPFVGMLFVKVWPHTYVGRRIVLQPVQNKPEPLPVQIGQSGVTLSEMRPLGTCEFDGQRVEAISAYGLLAPGTAVKVIAMNDRRPVVQAI